MIANALYRNPRLLVLIIGIIVVCGLSSFYVLPRMEDPVLGKRVAVITTALPGADAERVESLVTEKLEDRFRDIAEIKQIQSTSRAGISNIVIELRDDVSDVVPVWSRVRDRLNEMASELPAQATTPDFRRLELKALAAIVAVKWNREDSPNMAILRRLALDLKLALRDISGTETVQLFGDPGEEVIVEIKPDAMASLGLSIGAIAQQLRESDTRQPVGSVRSGDADLIVDVDDSSDSLDELGQTEIQSGPRGKTVSLADIATLSKGPVEPPSSLSFVDGERAVVVGAFVRDDFRIDRWFDDVQQSLTDFRTGLPSGIDVDLMFAQSSYVEKSLSRLLRSLLLGTLAVVVVVFLLMGMRSTIVVGIALPLSALMVVAGMRLLGIPIHQMSLMGLIIALGLLIDNAIVIVDEVRSRIWAGLPRHQAIVEGVRHLAMPLFGSTLTTTLAFAPIVLLPGPPGEFVGSIALSVILAINASFILALTVVPALTALLQRQSGRRTLVSYGLTSKALRSVYEHSLRVIFRVPVFGVILSAVLPMLGFLAALQLPEQFFPPTERDQIQVEIELAARASLEETRQVADEVRQLVTRHDGVSRMHWFIGESAPTFFYNLMPRRSGTPFYAQAMVELKAGVDSTTLIQQLQSTLNAEMPSGRILVRQLEQGPPFDAPIEIQLRGPDLDVLRQLGQQLRLVLSQTNHVIHTRSDLEETLPLLTLRVDQAESLLAGLSQKEIARQLYTALEGIDAGALMDGSEELPIRVRLARPSDVSLEELAAIQLQSPPRPGPGARPGPPNRRNAPSSGAPLSALASLDLGSEVAAIPRLNGQRMNEVKAYLAVNSLPSQALADFERRLAYADFQLPDGYSMRYAGEAEKRNEAVSNLLANAVVLFSLMPVALVAAFRSFRIALIIATVGCLCIGLGPAALWLFGYPFGFMAILGTMGLVGVAINDAIVVMAGIQENSRASQGDREALVSVVVMRTRHVIATTLTTMAGFTPLVIGGGRFWPPLAITIAAGVGGATLLALYFVPSLHLLLNCRGAKRPIVQNVEAVSPEVVAATSDS